MEILNRKEAPEFVVDDKMELIKANKQQLSNTIPVYFVNGGSQELIRIEFLFDAGSYFQQIPLQASCTNEMLEEGTTRLTADEIADKVDFYGAFLEMSITQDKASIVLFTLNKHLSSVLPVVEQVIKEASFPQHELDVFMQNKKQAFHVNNQKVGFVARKSFPELIFGKGHPYGGNVMEKDYDAITRNDLELFYKQYYHSGNCNIIVAGNVAENTYELLNKHFGGSDWNAANTGVSKKETSIVKTAREREHVIEMNKVMQSAIRIGKALFNKTHPDFQPLQILNTIYGGYFGSRLMSNIREDKGYTYGIGSGIVSLQHSGYFFISTEVGVEVCKSALDEIYFELNRLREELIPEEELSLVKNYLIGSFMRSIDGPFAMADRFKSVIDYGLNEDYYYQYISTIKNISASTLRELANRYFDKDSMTELVVGRK